MLRQTAPPEGRAACDNGHNGCRARPTGRSAWVRLTVEGTEVAAQLMQAWAAAQQRMFNAPSLD